MNRKSVGQLEDAAREVMESTAELDSDLDRQLHITAKQLIERLSMIAETYGGDAA